MDEPVNDPAPAADPAPVAEPSTPQSFIDGAGNFTEGWQDHYLSEDTRGNSRVAGGRITSVQGMMDTIANSDKMISGDKILRPNDSFGDADWDAFHTAGGWNNQPVEIKAPEGLPEGIWSDDRAKTFSEGFNDLRLNAKQVAGIMELHNADIMQQITNSNNAAETANAELEAGLLSDWGNAFTQKEHLGNVALNKGAKGDNELLQRASAKFGKDPDFIRIMANLGGDFSGTGAIPKIDVDPTPNDIQTQINKIMSSDAFMKSTHPEHTSTMSRLRQLHIDKTRVKRPA